MLKAVRIRDDEHNVTVLLRAQYLSTNLAWSNDLDHQAPVLVDTRYVFGLPLLRVLRLCVSQKAKAAKKAKQDTIRTDTFEMADISKDPVLGPDGAPNPKTTNPLSVSCANQTPNHTKIPYM